MDDEALNELKRQLFNAYIEIDKLAPTVLALEERLVAVTEQRDDLVALVMMLLAYYETHEAPSDWPEMRDLCRQVVSRAW